MRLLELEPQFLQRVDDTHFKHIQSVPALADGIVFVCPLCFQNNNKHRPGCHSVICWQPHVPQTTHPVPGRWNFLGTSYDDLTLQAGSSSILLTGEGCKAHFWIENGSIRF